MPDETKLDQRLFDIPAAVEYLKSIGASGATANWVRTLIAEGGLPRVKVGKKFVVSKAALDGWLDRHERRSR
jgi:excisionase family DNA binding protein